jgi:hypothetical protein
MESARFRLDSTHRAYVRIADNQRARLVHSGGQRFKSGRDLPETQADCNAGRSFASFSTAAKIETSWISLGKKSSNSITFADSTIQVTIQEKFTYHN